MQPKFETDSQSLSVRAMQCSTQPVLAQETLLVRNFTTTFQFVPRWIQIRHVTFHSEEDTVGLKFDDWLYNNGSQKTSVSGTREYERQHSRSLHEISGHGPTNAVALQGNFDYKSLEARATNDD